MAYVAGPDTSYAQLLPALVLAGIGTASFFASVANVVMGAVRPEEAGQASGATNAIPEIGGVLGIVVLAAVFADQGDYTTPAAFVDVFTPALILGAATVALGAAAALLIPRRRREAVAIEPAPQPA
jgi:MFS family permease